MSTPLEEILSRLPIQGGSTVGGSSTYANYLPILNASGQLDSSFFASTIQHIWQPATQTARLALTANVGDIAIQQDTMYIYMLASSPASTNGNWQVLGVTGGVPFDNTHTSFTATNVQAAINELWDKTLATNVARTATALVTFNTGSAPFAVVGTTVVTNLNADLLDGQQGAYYLTADNLTGTLPTGVLGSGPYTTNIVGNLTGTATVATTATTATTALACSGNAASADVAAACSGNSATATLATNATYLQAADSSYQTGTFFQNPANLTGGYIPNAVFDATSHGILSDPTLHAAATTIAAGFMSAADKAKLDTIDASAAQPTDAFASITINGSPALAASTYSDALNFVSDSGLLAITADTSSGKTLHFNVEISGLLHSQLGNLTDGTLLLYDDHPQYVTVARNRTITAQHVFNPASSSPPFYLGTNAQGQLVGGLNAELLNGQYGSYYTNASNITTGTLGTSRLISGGNYPINITGIASGNVVLSGNSVVTGNITATNFIDTVLVGTGNRLVYTSSTGTLLTDQTIISGLIATNINAIITAGTDITSTLVGSTLTLNVVSDTAATASKLVKRDTSGNIAAVGLAVTQFVLPSTDGYHYLVTLSGSAGSVVWNINQVPLD